MKKNVALLSTILLSILLSSCSTPPPIPPSAQPEKDLAIAENTFAWINAHRAKEGAKAIGRSAALDRLARKTASQIATAPNSNFRHITVANCGYARQVLHFEASGLSFQGRIASQAEPGLSAVNYWSKSKYGSARILKGYTAVGIGSFTKPNGQTIISVILGNRIAYDPSTWNKYPRNY